MWVFVKEHMRHAIDEFHLKLKKMQWLSMKVSLIFKRKMAYELHSV